MHPMARSPPRMKLDDGPGGTPHAERGAAERGVRAGGTPH
jgi:hypothetical protein